jgi:hypothetical protein
MKHYIDKLHILLGADCRLQRSDYYLTAGRGLEG